MKMSAMDFHKSCSKKDKILLLTLVMGWGQTGSTISQKITVKAMNTNFPNTSNQLLRVENLI